MAERTDTGRIWTMRVMFVIVAGGICFLHLMPLETSTGQWPAPDLLVAVAFCWAIRRPAFVPVLLVAAVFLLADLLFQRPPGLWAALVVGAVEWLKSRARVLRDAPLTLELVSMLAALVVITALYRLVHLMVLLPAPSLSLSLIQLALTLVALPVVMIASQLIFGLRRTAPGEVDILGHRL